CRQSEPSAVFRLVDVARGSKRCTITGAALHHAELVVHQRLRTEDPEKRLKNAQIDHLSNASSTDVAVVQRKHGCNGAEKGADAVGKRERRQGWWTIRLAGDVGKSAHRLGKRAEARLILVWT